jgi:hypothetical protein
MSGNQAIYQGNQYFVDKTEELVTGRLKSLKLQQH